MSEIKKNKKQKNELKKTEKIKEQEKITKKTNQSKNKRRNKNKKNKKNIPIIIIIVLIIALISILIIDKKEKEEQIKLRQETLKNEIIAHYNENVKTNKDSKIYQLKNNEYIESGIIGKEQEISLKETNITYKDEYLQITTFDEEYYINYQDIEPTEELTTYQDRYKKYIPWNLNIITNEKTNFYDEKNNLVYTFNQSFEFPIIIKKEDIYGIEFNNRLLYIKKDDVKEIKEFENTKETNTKGIAVLNYHFFFNAEDSKDQCNQGICLSTQNLKKHLNYIKDNNIFTPTLKELEMYIDEEIRLPKSVVLTIDDGWRAKIGSEVISEYQLNATIFLMSQYYDPRNYLNEYIEVHSHGHDIHNPGICPGGQGGAIKCLEKSKLLQDLKASQDKLNGTTYFCYPFYEYNDYSIQVLKEAGYTMAFGGSYEAGKLRAEPGINKFKIPRYVIMNYTSANDIARYIG